MSERPLKLKDASLRGFQLYREGGCVYARLDGYKRTYICRYTNEKAVAAIVRGWARARGFDV